MAHVELVSSVVPEPPEEWLPELFSRADSPGRNLGDPFFSSTFESAGKKMTSGQVVVVVNEGDLLNVKHNVTC